jgi:hypothetical protein
MMHMPVTLLLQLSAAPCQVADSYALAELQGVMRASLRPMNLLLICCCTHLRQVADLNALAELGKVYQDSLALTVLTGVSLIYLILMSILTSALLP